MATLERAIEIAVEAHKGQKDKAGNPYILHPLRLMFQMKTDNERMAAVLHDVVEDSDWTLDDLRKENFDNEVIDAVNLLTRDDNDSYEEFVQKAASNPISKAVKIADITDNLDLSRISKMTEKDVDRVKKYQRVLKILT
ncbi:MAG: HD domain-containing protein [Candidatus Marinimicrobia bacterium]|jgi:(p)ppGpp synthase/HD superfamily hydrolase|nr:HD domain-containing protein [Candidatus Neomarinimicrobiota bacterium]MBT7901017.1 HD domain-containing protein [Candidatus Neomarinimicrobiota bacterium]